MMFGFWSSANKSKELLVETTEEGKQPSGTASSADVSASRVDHPSIPEETQVPAEPPISAPVMSSDSASSEGGPAPAPAPAALEATLSASSVSEAASTPQPQKRFSWKGLVQPKGAPNRKTSLQAHREDTLKEATARQEYKERKLQRTRSEQRAHESALVVRDLIVGPFAAPSPAPPKKSKVTVGGVASVPSVQKVRKVKAQLLEPREAKKVIAQLRQMPSTDVPVVAGKTAAGEVKVLARGPIHAVCLSYPDEEAHQKHFAMLDKIAVSASSPGASPKIRARGLDAPAAGLSAEAVDGIASVTTTPFEKLKSVFSGLDVVSLILTPDLGLGQPAGSPGLLAGAVPTAKAVIEGVQELTPQLMALGYATGKSLLPSHAGVYPPTDRMSVITYWWGLEVVMPEPSVQYLSNVPSIAHTVVNFLTALAVASGGVRELMPFVRYISQYIDAEFSSIRDQDQGQGVVCAATWIMPAALVPRPWDFPAPPPSSDADASVPAPTPAIPAPAPAPAPPVDAKGPAAAPPPVLRTPPLPSPTVGPLCPGAAMGMAQTVPESKGAEDDVPGVTITPPTPHLSQLAAAAASVPSAAVKVVA